MQPQAGCNSRYGRNDRGGPRCRLICYCFYSDLRSIERARPRLGTETRLNPLLSCRQAGRSRRPSGRQRTGPAQILAHWPARCPQTVTQHPPQTAAGLANGCRRVKPVGSTDVAGHQARCLAGRCPQHHHNQPSRRYSFCQPLAGTRSQLALICHQGSSNMACASQAPSAAPASWQAT